MRKLIAILVIFLLVGCQTAAPKKDLKVLSPTGAPAVALIPELLKENHQVELVSGPENLQAALVNEAQDYDVIIAPLNLGANLLAKQKTKYKLHSIVTWGNLFVVARNPEAKKMAAFGEMAVPGLVFKHVMDELPFEAEITWVPSVSEAQAMLLSDQVDAALLAQPLVGATIGKAKQDGVELTVVANVQNMYNEKNSVQSYPQAALFVSESVFKKDVDALVQSMADYVGAVEDNKDQFVADIEKITTETSLKETFKNKNWISYVHGVGID